MKELILGGARSGKSRYAEGRAEALSLPVTYIATATAGDAEMAARIARHRDQRPGGWQTLEVPLHLAATLAEVAAEGRCVLVDCITLWLSNLLGHGCDAGVAVTDPDALFVAERQALLDVLPRLPGEILLVSNEVGQGIVPADALSRRFRDEAGWLHQALAQACERVTWVVAGLPQSLRGPADG